MTDDEDSGSAGPFAAGLAPMMAFATAMNRNWMTMAGLGGFPSGAGADTPADGDASDPWKGAMEAQMRVMASAWKSFGDVLSGSVDAAWTGQDKAAEGISGQMAEAVRNFTGMDPREMMAGTGREWSPQTVAFQSFGLADSDAAQFATELAQLATASSEAARTMFDLYRVVGDAWMEAAEAFGEANVEDSSGLGDLVALQRKWVATAEPVLQKALASDAFTAANAEFIRAASGQARARSAFARRFTDFIEAPNRQEMSETYEAIQDLRREVRQLRRKQKHLEQELAAVRGSPSETE